MQEIRQFGARMDDFGLELLNMLERAQAAPTTPAPTPTFMERR